MIRLCSGAEEYLRGVNLTDPQAEAVRKCVIRYVKPEKFCAKLDWLGWAVYRIVQAVRALFGCSEWQNTVKMIQNRYIELATMRGLIQHTSEHLVEKLLRREMTNCCNSIGEDILTFTLLFQSCKTETSVEFVNLLGPFRSEAYLLRMQTLRNETAAIRFAYDLHAARV